jgi:Arc/MetJ family transcription regulator
VWTIGVPTKLAIDDALLNAAQRLGGHATKADAINEALREYIRQRQTKVLDLFGTIEFESSYDYAKQRRQP